MNTMSVEIIEIPGIGPERKPRTEVTFRLLIDGQACREFGELCIDPCALMASANEEGNYFIATCGCGVPLCAGVTDGVQVLHTLDRIDWQIPVPYARGREKVEQAPAVCYAFNAEEYQQQMANIFASLEGLKKREDDGERFDIEANPGCLATQIIASMKGAQRWANGES